MARLAARPPGVRLLPFGYPAAEAVLSSLPDNDRYSSVHALRGRELYSATDAFRVILSRMRGGNVFIRTGAYRIYPFVVRHRSTIGRLVPDMSQPPID